MTSADYLQTEFHELGIPMDLHGYKQCLLSVELAVKNEDRLLSITKQIYQVVAEECGRKTACIERNIRTIIFRAWKNAPEHMNELAKRPLGAPPSVSEFISILTANALRQTDKNSD